jgi:hypothetical protein
MTRCCVSARSTIPAAVGLEPEDVEAAALIVGCRCRVGTETSKTDKEQGERQSVEASKLDYVHSKTLVPVDENSFVDPAALTACTSGSRFGS